MVMFCFFFNQGTFLKHQSNTNRSLELGLGSYGGSISQHVRGGSAGCLFL